MPDSAAVLQQWPILAVVMFCITIAGIAYAKSYQWLRAQVANELANSSTEIQKLRSENVTLRQDLQKVLAEHTLMKGELSEMRGELEAQRNGIKLARQHYLAAFRLIADDHPAYRPMTLLGEALA